MSLIGDIAGVPLFSTRKEALAWAAANGLSGYHSHSLQGQTGYMGGFNHAQATGMLLGANVPPPPPPPPTPTPPPPTTNRTSTPLRSSGSSGGGGY